MRFRHMVALAVMLVLFVTPTALDSCLIGDPVPVFMTRTRPADDRAFFGGKIGVIVSTYRLHYLIGAYRALSAKGFSDAEAEELTSPGPAEQQASPSALSSWLQTRQSVAGPWKGGYLSTYKDKVGDGVSYAYLNCLDDAFSRATGTLGERVVKWGADSTKIRDWVAAQDLVFANCSGKTATIPTDPTPDMEPLQVADRQYQIAAAHFYAGQWDQARQAFLRVAENSESPWRGSAPYLIARVYLREGMVDEKPQALAAANLAFQAVIKDPDQEAWHDASRRLLDFTGFRLHSWERLHEYAAELSGERGSEDLAQRLRDFRFLFEHAGDQEKLAETSDLADWILTFTGQTREAGTHAVQQWRKSHSRAWLIAALLSSPTDDAADLVKAAHDIHPDDPAYDSAVYYGIAAEIRAGHREEAREWANQALKRTLPISSRNRILSERIKLASTWNEFLRCAPRQPEPGVEYYDNFEISNPGARAKDGLLLDVDAARILNRHVPLLLFLDATRNPAMPSRLQMEVARAGFIRAIVLRRSALARTFMQRIVELKPAVAAAAGEFLSSPDAESAHFAGVLLILRTDGPNPILSVGWSSAGDLDRSNNHGAIRWGVHEAYVEIERESGVALPMEWGFLTELQRKQADLEWTQLKERSACGATYAENEAIQWALKHPDDSRVPEALYFAVRATFKGCRDGDVGKISKQAYTLLKERYPSSEWAKKTKYWYK